ncbi:hypothetical protein LJY25_12925 [Hymenobacter sp. BT175]|uniref:hypothetical protein n=1 Tax=Hymenobacter translucens TaxID=2886507 RepID=UPI001D0F1860|nr:hypothetical protein [Hymenobacter translucens]MCC2547351.1 hypothetical protein [Hymenobacter translucens]
MSAPRSFLLFLLALVLATGCARRKKDIPTARTAEAVTPAPAPEIKKRTARDLADVMTDELQLLPSQQSKVRAVLNETVEQVNAARQRLGADKAALGVELKRINANSEGELRQILTAAQYKEYQAKKRQMAEQMRARRAD